MFDKLEGGKICFDATSSFLGGSCAFGVAGWLLWKRSEPKLMFGAVALCGITLMQWVEGLLWLNGPVDGPVNFWITLILIPLALLGQAWGPLLGSLFVVPARKRMAWFVFMLLLGPSLVIASRLVYLPVYSQVTPEGHLNWWSPENPPHFVLWAYMLWAVVIGTPFLLWWRPFWESLVIVSWGWLWAVIAYQFSDSAASYWCFFVAWYALFVFLYSCSDLSRNQAIESQVELDKPAEIPMPSN